MNKEEFIVSFHPEKPDGEKDKIRRDLERIEAIQQQDDPGKGEDSLYDLANEEGLFRKFIDEEAEQNGIGALPQDFRNRVADRHSDKMLGSLEKEKAIRIDFLTGLRNRKALYEEVPKLISGERRDQKNLSVLLIDLDKFGEINKVYGFLAGDEILQKCAALIEKSIRSSDYVYRAGGEEFVVVLPGQGIREAYEAAERIRTAIGKEVMEVKDNVKNLISLKQQVSIGCSSSEQISEWIAEHGDPKKDLELLKDLIRNSDRALRQAKAGGRNQTVVFDEEGIDVRSDRQ